MKKWPYCAGEAAEVETDNSRTLAHGIHNGWVVGAISALVLLVGAVVRLAMGDGIGFVINLLAALSCAGLAYGVYRRSRVAAVALLLLFLALWLESLIRFGNFAGVLVEVIRLMFAVMLYQAMKACFLWHRGRQRAAPDSEKKSA
ncbi:hypothetical protein ACLD02_16985 [Alloalcanivorax sp. C16-2]|uniref:hypothetical protein n=1 Tax=Alloalcanivorax sp. C16-2 TaxID=3390052 RepID=UPI0039705BD9